MKIMYARYNPKIFFGVEGWGDSIIELFSNMGMIL